MHDTRDAARQAQSRRLQLEMFTLENNRSRLLRKREEVALRVKHMKGEIARLQEDLRSEEFSLDSMDHEIALLGEEINRQKKKMNAV